jgi:hypothetical protein
MPTVERVGLTQRAVMWAPSGVDNYGNTRVSSPVEILCGWPQVKTKPGNAQSDAVSRTEQLAVDRDIAIGSILWLGSLADLPDTPESLREVVSVTKTPDIKGRQFRYTVGLAAFSNSLPAVV